MIKNITWWWEQLNGPQVTGIMKAIEEWFKTEFDDNLDYINNLSIDTAKSNHLTIIGKLMGIPRVLLNMTSIEKQMFTYDFTNGIQDGTLWGSFAPQDVLVEAYRQIGGSWARFSDGIEMTQKELEPLPDSYYRAILQAVSIGEGEVGSLRMMDEILMAIYTKDQQVSQSSVEPFWEYDWQLDYVEGSSRYPGDITLDLGDSTKWDNISMVEAIVEAFANGIFAPEPRILPKYDSENLGAVIFALLYTTIDPLASEESFADIVITNSTDIEIEVSPECDVLHIEKTDQAYIFSVDTCVDDYDVEVLFTAWNDEHNESVQVRVKIHITAIAPILEVSPTTFNFVSGDTRNVSITYNRDPVITYFDGRVSLTPDPDTEGNWILTATTYEDIEGNITLAVTVPGKERDITKTETIYVQISAEAYLSIEETSLKFTAGDTKVISYVSNTDDIIINVPKGISYVLDTENQTITITCDTSDEISGTITVTASLNGTSKVHEIELDVLEGPYFIPDTNNIGMVWEDELYPSGYDFSYDLGYQSNTDDIVLTIEGDQELVDSFTYTIEDGVIHISVQPQTFVMGGIITVVATKNGFPVTTKIQISVDTVTGPELSANPWILNMYGRPDDDDNSIVENKETIYATTNELNDLVCECDIDGLVWELVRTDTGYNINVEAVDPYVDGDGTFTITAWRNGLSVSQTIEVHVIGSIYLNIDREAFTIVTQESLDIPFETNGERVEVRFSYTNDDDDYDDYDDDDDDDDYDDYDDDDDYDVSNYITVNDGEDVNVEDGKFTLYANRYYEMNGEEILMDFPRLIYMSVTASKEGSSITYIIPVTVEDLVFEVDVEEVTFYGGEEATFDVRTNGSFSYSMDNSDLPFTVAQDEEDDNLYHITISCTEKYEDVSGTLTLTAERLTAVRTVEIPVTCRAIPYITVDRTDVPLAYSGTETIDYSTNASLSWMDKEVDMHSIRVLSADDESDVSDWVGITIDTDNKQIIIVSKELPEE